MIVRLAEVPHGTPQCDLHMWRLHLAVCKVGSEFQVAFHIVRVLFNHSTPLKFDGNTKDVLPGQGNCVSPLPQIRNCLKSNCEPTHVLALGIRGDRDQQKSLERCPDHRLRFRQLVPRYKTESLGKFRSNRLYGTRSNRQKAAW